MENRSTKIVSFFRWRHATLVASFVFCTLFYSCADKDVKNLRTSKAGLSQDLEEKEFNPQDSKKDNIPNTTQNKSSQASGTKKESFDLSVPEDESLTWSISEHLDYQSDEKFEISSSPRNGTGSTNFADRSITYKPKGNYFGNDEIKIKSHSLGANRTYEITLNIMVTPVNDPPVPKIQTLNIAEEESVSIQLKASDDDGDQLEFAIVQSPEKGLIENLNSELGTLTYTGNLNATGEDVFYFTVSDGSETSDPTAVKLNLDEVNDPPVAYSQNIETSEDTPITINLRASDVDNDTSELEFIITKQPQNAEVTCTEGSCTYTPTKDYYGSDSFDYKVHDGLADSSTETISINILPVNDPPVLVLDRNVMIKKSRTEWPLSVVASDVEDGIPQITITSQTQNGVLELTDTHLIYKTEPFSTGSDSFAIEIVDSEGSSLTANISLNVQVEVQSAKIKALRPQEFDFAGSGVAIEGSYIIVGKPGTTSIADSGAAADIFRLNAGQWQHSQELKIDGLDNLSEFGQTVAISGNQAFVSAPRDNYAARKRGRVFIFENNGNVWNHTESLTASDDGENVFGSSLDTDGETAAVGAPMDSLQGLTNSGAVYMFHKNEGTWSQHSKLKPSGLNESSRFGHSVALAGDLLVAGAYGDSTVAAQAGAAYVFQKNGNSWSLVQKLTASNAGTNALFGYSVAIHEETIAISAIGTRVGLTGHNTVYIFEKVNGTWQEQQKLNAFGPDVQGSFGYSLAMTGSFIAVGAPGADSGENGKGAVYLFKKEINQWATLKKLTNPLAATYERLGRAVDIDNVTIIGGAPGENSSETKSGAAFIFTSR